MKRAVALHYDRRQDAAPRVVAKGQGEVAERMIDLARLHQVPLRAEPNLVRLLEETEIGNYIPEGAYKIVAQILVFLYQQQGKVL